MMPSGLAVRSVPQHQRQQWHLSANGPSMLPRIVEQQAMYLDQWQQTDTMHDAGVRLAAALEMLADNTRWQGEAKQQLADEARHHQVAAVRQAGSLADVQELQGCRCSYRGPQCDTPAVATSGIRTCAPSVAALEGPKKAGSSHGPMWAVLRSLLCQCQGDKVYLEEGMVLPGSHSV